MRVVPGTGPGIVAVATVHAESEELAALLSFDQLNGTPTAPVVRVNYPLFKYTKYRDPRGSDGTDPDRLSGVEGKRGLQLKYGEVLVKMSGDSGVLLYADVEVQVPAGLGPGMLKNHVGPITGQNLDGTLTFLADSGDIDLSKVSGLIRIKTGSGDVTVEGSGAGWLNVGTGRGDVKVEHFSGEQILCGVVQGSVTLRASASRSVSVTVSSGDVVAEVMDVEEFASHVGSGDVLFESPGARLRKVSCDVGSGDVVVEPGTGASVEVPSPQTPVKTPSVP